jgi:UDP-N-acetylmuramate dehydrogenase
MMQLLQNASLRAYNTFGLDARADWLGEVGSVADLQALVADPRFDGLPKMILGGGSNILFTDDVHALVIRNRITGISTVSDGPEHCLVTAGGGEVWHDLVRYTIDQGCGGLENLSLIPGSVGAAPIQNIGAYGVEVKDHFERLEAVDLSTGAVKTFGRDDCAFGYRDSIFKREAKGRYAIVGVTFRLDRNPLLRTHYGAIEQELTAMGVTQPGIRDVSEAVIRIRRSKLPDPAVIGNAGSFFKNPEVEPAVYNRLKATHPDLAAYPGTNGTMKLAAGWLIERAGWKGKRIGKVGMHDKQALVLVNHGGATGRELLDHARRVQASVREQFGVELEMEVNIL